MPRRDCAATSKTTGLPCKRAAVYDSRFCKAHSRHLPHDPVRVVDLAEQRAARKTRNRISQSLRSLGIDVGDADPIRIFEAQMRVREGDFEFWRTRIQSEGDNPQAQTLTQYHAACDRLADVARVAIAANLEDRKVRVAESQLMVSARIIMAVLTHPDLGLSPELVDRAHALAIVEARRLEGGDT